MSYLAAIVVAVMAAFKEIRYTTKAVRYTVIVATVGGVAAIAILPMHRQVATLDYLG